MAKYSQTVEYNIRTTLDASGISKLQSEIRQVQVELQKLSSQNLLGKTQYNEAMDQLSRLRKALNDSFNADLGMLNMTALGKNLKEAGISLDGLNKSFSAAGIQGRATFNSFLGQIGKIDTGLKTVSKTTDKIFNTIGNTVRWGVVASGFQQILNGAHAAVQYMSDLDASLTNIMLVTDYTKQDMREFAQYANEAAAALGNTTVAYTNAALIYAQQGYDLDTQKELANLTLQVANVTGQDTADVSDQITAVMNGYQLSAEEATAAFDRLAMVANVSAADVEELANAAARVASTANTLGVSQDQFAPQIATIVSVTREAPENVGNALKTIYARLGDLQMGETLEDGTTLGNLSGLLETVGVSVLDDSGSMRNMGDIMEDLMAEWGSFDRGTQQSLASTLAGKYQMNRFMTLMTNAEMYNDYLQASMDSTGTLEEMQGEYLDSLAGKLNTLQATFEGFLTDIFNQDDFGVVIEGLTALINGFSDLIEAVGGGGAALTAFGAVATKIFSGSISRGINNVISNRNTDKLRQQNVNAGRQLMMDLSPDGDLASSSQTYKYITDSIPYWNSLSEDGIQRYNENLDRTAKLESNLISRNNELETSIEAINMAARSVELSDIWYDTDEEKNILDNVQYGNEYDETGSFLAEDTQKKIQGKMANSMGLF